MSSGPNGIGPFAQTVTGRGWESISLADGLVHSLTPPATSGPFLVTIVAVGGALRYRDDGTDPTNATGFLCAENGEIQVQPNDITCVKLIRNAADAGSANVIYHTASTAAEA